MKLSRKHVPNVPVLLEREDVEGLVEAARFEDLAQDVEGRAVDRGIDIREQAVLALGALGPEAGDGTVADALKDPADSVRSAAVRVLYARGDALRLARALGYLGAAARRLAVEALLKLDTTEAAAGAATASVVTAPGEEPLSDGDVELIHRLAQPDGGEGPVAAVVNELVRALSDERGAVSDRAEELLVQLAPASTRAVIGELERGGSPERAAAVLGRIADTSALEPLLRALERSEADVRVQAAAALGALCHPDAVEPLITATRDPELDVRAEASYALDRMGTAAVIVGMRAVLRPMVDEAVASAAQRPHANGNDNGAGNGTLRTPAPAGPLGLADLLKDARANGHRSNGHPAA